MPELPDITIYLEAMAARIQDEPLEKIQLRGVALLRTVEPPLPSFEGQVVRELRRIGKRIVWGFDDERFLVFHLMIAGRFRWKKRGAKPPGRVGHAAFQFPTGTLVLTEQGTKKRATLHAVQGEEALAQHDRGGIDVRTCNRAAFEEALVRENHTLKRTLTDPRFFSGIGNAYSDEILHRAGLSPVKLSQKIKDDEIDRLFEATRTTLEWWIAHLRDENGQGFPEKVTAFRPEMAVHGRFQDPCPVCGSPVQRIVHAENETNYCATCQTGGKLLADRALSRLLKKDWPRTLEEMEQRRPKDERT
ncbi:MAG: formamidopyrimidine-DNA glycosylase [bacterium]|nr:formamidopyrimidine-DNA glycosylase [bacterium]